MSLFVVRHASAGDRSAWIGDDDRRPVDERGSAQSLAIRDLIWPMGCTALISSPATRCLQTLEPLATRAGLPVLIDVRLAEAAEVGPVLGLLEDCSDGTVLCSHGDLIPATIAALERRGMTLRHAVPKVRKGSVFAIDRRGGRFVSARHWSRPGS